MKSSRKKMVRELARVLLAAGRRPPEEMTEAGDQWQASVMAHVRRLGRLSGKAGPNGMVYFNRVVWRFAAAALLIGCVLFVSYIGISRVSAREYDLMADFLDDPDGSALTGLNGEARGAGEEAR